MESSRTDTIPTKVAILQVLARAMMGRALEGGPIRDLDAAVSANQQILDLIESDDPLRAITESDLADVLILRFERTGSLDELNAAIDALRRATALAHNDDYRATLLINFGSLVR